MDVGALEAVVAALMAIMVGGLAKITHMMLQLRKQTVQEVLDIRKALKDEAEAAPALPAPPPPPRPSNNNSDADNSGRYPAFDSSVFTRIFDRLGELDTVIATVNERIEHVERDNQRIAQSVDRLVGKVGELNEAIIELRAEMKWFRKTYSPQHGLPRSARSSGPPKS